MTATKSGDVFDRMRRSYALAGGLGLPNIKSEYWETLLTSGRQEHGGKGDFIERDDLWLDFRNNVITKGLDNANVPDELLEQVHAKWRRIYEELGPAIPKKLRPLLAESPIGNPKTLTIDGIDVTQSSLEYTFMLSHLAPYLANAKVVIDIGGGYGGLARLIKLTHPEMKLVLLDLPEVNTIQTYFLSTAFPDAKVHGLSDVSEKNVLDPRAMAADILVLPGQLIDRLAPGSFDVAVNTRSMMEMSLETVSFYVDNIQKKIESAGAFFCLNRYEKKTRLKEYPFDARWRVLYSEPWPELIDQNPHRELIAIRTNEAVEDGLKQHVATFPPHDGPLKRLGTKLTRLTKLRTAFR